MKLQIISKIKNHQLLRTGINFSFASTLNTFCTLLVGFLNMRWLGPELLGIWQSLTIINSYLPFTQLGIQSGLNLNLPVLLGANEKEKAKQQVETGLAYAVFLSALFFFIAIVVVIVLIINNTDHKILYGVITIAITAITGCFQLHFIATFRSAGAFDKLTRIYLIESVTSLVLVFFIYKYLYYGLLIYQCLHAIIHVLLLYYFAPYRKKAKPHFLKKCFIELLKPGLFMVFHNQIVGIIRSMPRLLLLRYGGVISVGLFSPALTVGTCMNLIPDQLGTFLHPQMGYKYGQTHCAKDMWKYFRTITILAPLVLLPVSIIGWFVMPYILEYIFPKYIASLWPIRVMLIGFLFSTAYLSRGFLMSLKAYRQLIILEIVDLLLFVVVPIFFIKFSTFNVLIALSIGLSISYFLTYIINITVVKHTIFLDKYNQA